MTQASILNNSTCSQKLNRASGTAQWLNLTQQNDCQSTGVTLESLNAQQANIQQQIVQAEQNFNSQLMVKSMLLKVIFDCLIKN